MSGHGDAFRPIHTRPSLLPFPTLRITVPHTVSEQAIQIWKVAVAVDAEIEAFAVFLARPFSDPRSPTSASTSAGVSRQDLENEFAFHRAVFALHFGGQ
jgi:hypothetical protein